MALTQKKLEKFVKLRNRSGFSSNLQFEFDLRSCGLTLEDIGQARKTEDGDYYWVTPHGLLVETFGTMFLSEAHADEEYDIPCIVEQARKAAWGQA